MNPSDVTLIAQIACVEREIKIRRSVYPQWVKTGRMKQAAADMELVRMEAVLATLKRLQAANDP